ncbi:heme oxygenase (biliverdin-producing) [Actinokineospora sp. G85]|uniref:biliverdin-producing heme oxygenase n=1 Tax=Actinokineospora sp. G85 TaxID=3406626 RepID=UPI003C713991
MTAVDEGFAARLRAATRGEHEHAERLPFFDALLAGALDRRAYTALLGQNHAFYTVLEDAGEVWRGHPLAGPFVVDALLRRSALEADLEFLLGADWLAETAPMPATAAYVDRLREVAFTDPVAFVAHHYTRYLGDLSGGQVLLRGAREVYGLDRDGVRFFLFDDIDRIKPFRDRYRALLDGAPFDDAQRAALIAEANHAFRLNRAVFDGLGERFR